MLHAQLRACWDGVTRQSEFQQRRLAVEDFNRKNHWRKRGICMIPTKFGAFHSLHAFAECLALLTNQSCRHLVVGKGLHKLPQALCKIQRMPYLLGCLHIMLLLPSHVTTRISLFSLLNGQCQLTYD